MIAARQRGDRVAPPPRDGRVAQPPQGPHFPSMQRCTPPEQVFVEDGLHSQLQSVQLPQMQTL